MTTCLRAWLGSGVLLMLAHAEGDKPLLLQQPTLSKTQIAFSYAGDLWIAPREGGEAKRLTNAPGLETGPIFSPDGKQIAFTGEYDGNVDVYVMPAAGGEPRRVTWHPGQDTALAWTPDGKRILFRSARDSYSRFSRLFTIDVAGGVFPAALPLPMAEEGSYSADGSHLAYVPLARAFTSWKHYRGGRTTPIWLADLADSQIEKIPRKDSNDFNPMWIGDRIYFLSDRDGPATLFCYDSRTKQVRSSLKNDGLDITAASAGPGGIIYEQFGSLHLFDLKSEKSRRLDIRIAGDLPEVRSHFVKLTANRIQYASLSPTGVRAVLGARGEIFTVPGEKGDIRNLTNTTAANERDPAWSPDGKHIAYFSDESGEYQLYLRDQTGLGEPKKIKLGEKGFYFSPVWSPDSKKIAYLDDALNTMYVEIDKGAPVRADTDDFDEVPAQRVPVWSPDSRWIAYTKQLKSHLRAVFVYSLENGKSTQLTDGMSDARYPVFDKSGKYLYFAASTDVGPTAGNAEMSNFGRNATRSVYAAVLRKDLPSPLAPESDEEKADKKDDKAEKKDDKRDDKPADKADAKKEPSKEPVKVAIDFDNISQRIVALPIPNRPITNLHAGKAGMLYVIENVPSVTPGPPANIVHKFDLEKRKFDKVLDGVNSFALSNDGEKMLVRQAQRWFIAKTSEPPKPGEGTLKVEDMEVRVDPRAEWRQMYHEAFRIERDFFYDPGAHGMDLKTYEKKYEPYLEALASRHDLNYLFSEIWGELTVGHLFVGGGDMPDIKRVPIGLLGADYKIENGRYRFARVYNGEGWNPQLRAPLTQPGVNVVTGEYLLAVNGRDLRGTDNVYSFFESTSGKSIILRVGPDPAGANSREVVVVPIPAEYPLRNLAWIEDNRRKVDQMTNGRVAYVYIPDTSLSGYNSFNRYFFAQVGKEGAVIDERFNGGGALADYIVDHLRRPLLNFISTRHGADVSMPLGAIYGPKAMIINEVAGSGGDAMPYYFHAMKAGTLVGKRTWGGLVGIFPVPGLMDGGGLTAPNHAIWLPNGEWGIENIGVPPDVEVENDPAAVRAGHDPQLEKAVQIVIDELGKNPLPTYKRPAYPNYHKGDAAVTTGSR